MDDANVHEGVRGPLGTVAVPEAASASNRAAAVCDDDDDPLNSGEPGASACSSRRKSGYFCSN